MNNLMPFHALSLQYVIICSSMKKTIEIIVSGLRILQQLIINSDRQSIHRNQREKRCRCQSVREAAFTSTGSSCCDAACSLRRVLKPPADKAGGVEWGRGGGIYEVFR